MVIIYGPKFTRKYKKLADEVKDVAEAHEALFRLNPFDPRLRTHKLKGRLQGLLSFSIGFKYRIIFEFVKNHETVVFHAIGDHDVYQ